MININILNSKEGGAHILKFTVYIVLYVLINSLCNKFAIQQSKTHMKMTEILRDTVT